MVSEPTTPYAELGGEAGIRRLVHRFYQLMDTLPEAWDVRQMHPEDLSGSEEKLFMYLTGWPTATRASGPATCPSPSPAASATSGSCA